MENPLVTIITANYNNVTFLDSMLTSVERQQYHNIEHVIIDDGSNDGSCEILKEYTERNSFAKVIFNKKNCGCVPALRNQAVRLSNGKYIMNFDSDDLLYSDAVSALVAKAESDDLSVCFGSMIYMDEHGSPYKFKELVGSPYKPGRLIKKMYIAFPRMYRRELYDMTSGYNEDLRIADDWDLYLRFEEKSDRFGWAGKRPLLSYRISRKSLSNSADKVFFQGERDTVKQAAHKRRNAKRILILGKKWNQEYVDRLRRDGNDVCTFFPEGEEDLDLEQFVWGRPYKKKFKYRIPLISELRKMKIVRKRPFDEIRILRATSLGILLLVRIHFPFARMLRVNN